jgi:hypothetical protein
MTDSEKLIKDFLEDRVRLEDMTTEQLDSVLDSLIEIGESLLNTNNHQVGVAILKVLDAAIDLRCIDAADAGFEQAIQAAEARGSTYWEFEEYLVH